MMENLVKILKDILNLIQVKVIVGNTARKICIIEDYKDKVLQSCHDIDKIVRENKINYLIYLDDNKFIHK